MYLNIIKIMKETNDLMELLDIVKQKTNNEQLIKEIEDDINNKNTTIALKKIERFLEENDEEWQNENIETFQDQEFDAYNMPDEDEEDIEEEQATIYPRELLNSKLEKDFIGMLLSDPKLMAKYYILHDECYFDDKIYLEIYKGIVFTEGEAFTPYIAKQGYNFGKVTYTINQTKAKLIEEYKYKNINQEKTYTELKKLFILRKNYLSMPIRSIQKSIVEITKYLLYDKMTEQEIKDAVNQVMVTDKFKQSILSSDLTKFLTEGNNNLTNGLSIPFNILSSVFKGFRRGETMAFAMPSNAGKSRLTIFLAAYIAYFHKEKVLIISNEMSEEKMKLCLITTILNNKMYQEIHGITIKKTEGELLEFKFRPDDAKKIKVDENGFVLKEEGENQEQFAQRLSEISTEYRKTIEVTDWVNNQTKNSIYFVNITDHTNDELQKIILNYYYKEDIHYMFYDTLKTDTGNIGNGEEIKKTATILSNLAQNMGLFICSSLQLMEGSTLPLNLSIIDLAVSRTVKEVLDTLCLAKQITNEHYSEYEYSKNEIDTVFYNIEDSGNPDERYYACVVDKNRAGAKPKVLLKINLAYNHWEELGYLRLK